MKSRLSKKELQQRLSTLAQSAPPRADKLAPGAMCYAKKSFSGTTEIACSHCHQLTHFQKGYAMEALDRSLRLVQAIEQLPHTLEIKLDTRFYCLHCNKTLQNTKEPLAPPSLARPQYKETEDELQGLYLFIKIGATQRRVAIDNHGLQALLAFLKESPVMIDGRDREYPLISEIKNLGLILGLEQT